MEIVNHKVRFNWLGYLLLAQILITALHFWKGPWSSAIIFSFMVLFSYKAWRAEKHKEIKKIYLTDDVLIFKKANPLTNPDITIPTKRIRHIQFNRFSTVITYRKGLIVLTETLPTNSFLSEVWTVIDTHLKSITITSAASATSSAPTLKIPINSASSKRSTSEPPPPSLK